MNATTPSATAAPDFSDPLGLLRAGHQQILDHCARLTQLASHLQTHGADSAALQTAGTLYRYFTTAARHHHDDEELDLFPRLARQSLKLADRVHRMKQEHTALDTLWRELEPQLLRPGHISDLHGFAQLCGQFEEAYQRHIAVEESELLEMAHHIFSQAELMKLGSAMAERRGVRVGYL